LLPPEEKSRKKTGKESFSPFQAEHGGLVRDRKVLDLE